jgi:molybdopterin-guanine dinucleotide biosynthesis protein A
MTPRGACTGAVLAGGESSRMGGRPKGLERVRGERIVDRVAAALREAADDVIIVSNQADASTWLADVPVARDRRAGAGPLAGVHAALVHAGQAVLVAPWDAPFVPGALLRALRDAGELEGADAAVPLSAASPWGFEPLCAWYAPTALAAIEAQLDSREFSVGALERRARVLRVDVSAWGDPAVLFFNVNTPADLERAAQLASAPVSP